MVLPSHYASYGHKSLYEILGAYFSLLNHPKKMFLILFSDQKADIPHLVQSMLCHFYAVSVVHARHLICLTSHVG